MSRANIEAALETALNGMTSLSTAWRNTSFTPTPGTAYQRVSFLYAEPNNDVFGPGFQDLGYMQIDLMYPTGKGPKDARARADLIRSTFARGSSFSAGGTSVIIDQTPTISDGVVENDRWKVICKIHFYVNEYQ